MKKRFKVSELLPCVIITMFSFGLLYFCSASSPRYAINPWVDANAFFTVGKAMANGIIPYKDIFEEDLSTEKPNRFYLFELSENIN